MVRPDTKAHKSYADRGRHHYGIPEDWLAREHRNDLRSKRERRDNQNVDFRMAENPEEVHPQYGGATRLRVKEMGTQKTIERKHHLRSRKRRYRQEHHCGHDQVQPDKQRHLAECHPGTAQAYDCRQNVYGCSNAAKSGDQQAESPEIGTVPW